MAATLNLQFPKGFFRDYARGRACQVRIAGVVGRSCAGGETTVLAHYSMPGLGGMAKKSPDLCGAWACHICHDIIDGRTRTQLEPEILKFYHLEGVMRTLNELVKAGVLPNPV